jgi:hypothetical protein
MAYQGCSRFNPVVLLSNDDMAGDPDARNDKDAANRRVVIFLFRPRKTAPSDWPCPRVKESADACRAQFWPDGDQRRQNGAQERLYKETRDTMACRFYDRQARRSPCEGRREDLVPLVIRVLDANRLPRAGAAYALDVGGKALSGVTGPDGIVRKRIPRTAAAGSITIDGQPMALVIEPLPDVQDLRGVQLRLDNLHYDVGSATGILTGQTQDALRAFQNDVGLPATGQPDAATLAALVSIYGS